jgi:hypothetical protein
MLSRLDGRPELIVEVISRPRAEFRCDEYYALELPVAPAIMVGEEIVVEGKDIDEATLAATIRRGLELSSRED